MNNISEAPIPVGFTVSEITGEQSINGGLVIYEIPAGATVDWTNKTITIGETTTNLQSTVNQYVWVPVEVTETDTPTNIASFYRSAWENNARTDTETSTSFPKYYDSLALYTEPYASGYAEETTEYNDMLESVYTYHGFYIGRYEAGSKMVRINFQNGTIDMVVRKDAYPYNYVGWGLTIV